MLEQQALVEYITTLVMVMVQKGKDVEAISTIEWQ
jgi:hypothetical protein